MWDAEITTPASTLCFLVRYAIAGGAAIDPEVLKGLKRFGIVTIQGYGLTESSPIAALNQEHSNRDSAIGLPLPEMQLEIVDPDKDGVGEIRIKGPNIMMGYYEDPELTATVLKDGWFYSGDIGYEDKDGFFYITGRISEMEKKLKAYNYIRVHSGFLVNMKYIMKYIQDYVKLYCGTDIPIGRIYYKKSKE